MSEIQIEADDFTTIGAISPRAVVRLPPSERGYLVRRTVDGLEVSPGDMHHGTLPAALDVGTADAVSLGDMTSTMLAMRAQRDAYADRAERAEAQLAALREAASSARALIGWDDGSAGRRLDDVLANTAAAAEAHDRRVRAEALREAADALRGRGGEDSAAALWLRARADEIERAR